MAKKNIPSNATAPVKSAANVTAATNATIDTRIAPKKSAAKPKAGGPSSGSDEVRSDDIALRAYFIAENRRLQGLPGDESKDWLEAERQITAERGSSQSVPQP